MRTAVIHYTELLYYFTDILKRDNDIEIYMSILSQEHLRRMLANYSVFLNVSSMVTC